MGPMPRNTRMRTTRSRPELRRRTGSMKKLKDKFTEDDKKVIADGTKDVLQWLEGNPNEDADAYEAKQKELEGKFNPIMMRIYQATGQQPGAPGADMGAPGGAPGGGDEDIGLD